MRVPGILSVIILTCIASPGYSAEPDEFAKLAAHISPTQLMQTVRELSNFDGRQSGTAGGQATAAYIARHLPEAALQPFPITTVQVDALVHAEIRVDRRVVALEKGQDFLPIINLAPTGQVSAPVLFVGYGIAAPGQGLDEYQGHSAAGKVVLFLRGQPKGFPGRVTLADKVRTAHARGAVAGLRSGASRGDHHSGRPSRPLRDPGRPDLPRRGRQRVRHSRGAVDSPRPRYHRQQTQAEPPVPVLRWRRAGPPGFTVLCGPPALSPQRRQGDDQCRSRRGRKRPHRGGARETREGGCAGCGREGRSRRQDGTVRPVSRRGSRAVRGGRPAHRRNRDGRVPPGLPSADRHAREDQSRTARFDRALHPGPGMGPRQRRAVRGPGNYFSGSLTLIAPPKSPSFAPSFL